VSSGKYVKDYALEGLKMSYIKVREKGPKDGAVRHST
jgi:hypothetical protein